MGIGLIHLYYYPLQVVRPLVDFEESNLDFHLFQLLFVNDGNSAVDADNVVDAGNKEEKTYVRVAV